MILCFFAYISLIMYKTFLHLVKIYSSTITLGQKSP